MRCVRFSLPRAILVFTVLASLCAARAAEVNWPGWRGPNRDGKSSDKGLLKSWPADGPKLLWKVTGIGQGFSSVSFGGGLIYITGRKEAGNPSKVPEAKHVYVRPGDRKYITAIDMQGKVKWSKDVTAAYLGYYKGARATPTYDNGNLYLLTGTGEIGCYDATTGDAKWKRDFKEFNAVVLSHGYGFSESVLIVGDLAVVSPGGDCFMVALDKHTGKTVWQSGKYAGAQHSSAIHVVYQGVPMIINGSHKGLVCVHAKTGKILWTQDFAQDNTANVPTPAFSDGYVFWAVGYGKGGICLKLSVSGGEVTATEAWRTAKMDCHHGGYVIVDGHIYGSHNIGWSCLDLKTGAQKWFDRGVGKGALCWADGMLYLYNEQDGTAGLATCSPDGLQMKGTVKVSGEGPSWAHPVVVGGRLYLRYDDNLYCFDVAGDGRPGAMAPGNADQDRRLFQVSYASGQSEQTFTNSIGMKFRLIPAGEFMMGSPDSEEKRGKDEGPVHRVRITKPFYLGVYEVTQEQYEKIAGENPAQVKGPALPAVRVNWDDVAAFIRKLSAKEGRTYRLPTEAEWEYACRAGTTTTYAYGKTLSPTTDANVAGSPGKPESGRPAPVGSFAANAWGLHDMHGNVWEWCQDWYGEDYYKDSPTDDPTGPASGARRANRGGGYYSPAEHCRAARRYGRLTISRYPHLGFRLVLVPEDSSQRL